VIGHFLRDDDLKPDEQAPLTWLLTKAEEGR
jgi:hypothetical protein